MSGLAFGMYLVLYVVMTIITTLLWYFQNPFEEQMDRGGHGRDFPMETAKGAFWFISLPAWCLGWVVCPIIRVVRNRG